MPRSNSASSRRRSCISTRIRIAPDLFELEGHFLTDKLALAIVDSPPLDSSKGGYIAEGYDAALDALRATGGEAEVALCWSPANGAAGLDPRVIAPDDVELRC